MITDMGQLMNDIGYCQIRRPWNIISMDLTNGNRDIPNKVKAKVHLDRSDPPIQDGASHWLNFMEIISKEKYEGNEPFEIGIIQSYVPGGPVIRLVKEGESYFFSPNIQLTFHDEAIGDQLEEIWEHNQEIRDAYTTDGDYKEPKWKSIRATVTHDPDNFGKAYLVSHIELTE